MIYKCPNCHGALEYDPASDKMYCAHCGNDYFMWELDEDAVEYHQELPTQSEIKEEKKLDFTEERTIYDEPEFIECKVYTCSSCGAELSLSDKEVSTYCAYCGQPTIVYNRVDKTQKPKYIIPFKITKEEAETAIREKLKKGFFIPKEVKNFEAERITGIYIPYFLYDITFYQRRWINVGFNKNSDLVEGDCNFIQVCQDASDAMNDELACGLEPYDLSGLQDFDAGYLSGFYADRFDLSGLQLTNRVVKKCQQMFDDEVCSRCKGIINKKYANCSPKYAITKADYAFLPVWFMTFRYKDVPYTMMVNGQTGKVTGTVPFLKAKAVLLFLLLMLLFSVPLVTLLLWLYYKAYFIVAFIPFFIVPCLPFAWILAISTKKKYDEFKKSLKLTKNQSTEKLAKERQGKDE